MLVHLLQVKLTEDIQVMVIHPRLVVNNKDRDLLTYRNHNHNNQLHQEHHLTAIVNHQYRQQLALQFHQRQQALNHIHLCQPRLIAAHHRFNHQCKECHQHLCLKIIRQQVLQIQNITVGQIRFVAFSFIFIQSLAIKTMICESSPRPST